MDIQAFSKLIEPIVTRMDAIEQRLGRIETALSGLTNVNPSPFANPRPTPTASSFPPPVVPQKRPCHDTNPEPGPALRNPSARYQYRPVDVSKNEIRILGLDPCINPSDPITGIILHLSLDSLPARHRQPRFVFGSPDNVHGYNALSYAWGKLSAPGGSHIFVSGGGSIAVTANLAAALRQLRGTDARAARSLWWIDAVCINQDDVAERNSQVALMRRIYASATKVQVWLGGEADGSGTAMGLVRKLADPPRRGPGLPEVDHPYVPDDVRRNNLACLAALFQRDWWDRVWVRQEVALGQTLDFLCGAETCTLEELTAAESALGDSLLHLRLDSKRSDMAHVPRLMQANHARRAEGFRDLRNKSGRGDHYIDLCTLLLHARGCKATELPDKVFGVLGLADPAVYGLKVDYGLLPKDLFRLAATAIITKTSSLDILGAAQNVDRRHSLPSWAPNLFDPWKAQPFPTDTNLFTTGIARHPLAHKPSRHRFSPSGKTLTVTGQIFGRITHLGSPVANHTHSNQDFTQLLTSWISFARTSLTAPQTPNGSAPKTFNFGLDAGDFRTPEERCVARLLFVPRRNPQRPDTTKGLFTFTSGAQGLVGTTEADASYARSLLAPEAWSVVDDGRGVALLLEGVRRYGAGRTVGCCGRDVGLFPEEAREGDVVVYLQGAENPFVLRKMTGGYLLVGDAGEFGCFFFFFFSVSRCLRADC